MTQPIPASVNTNGTMLALFVPTLANYLSGASVAELTAGAVLDITCYLTGDGLTTETSENNVEDARLCSKQVFENRGDFTQTMELTYVFNQSSPSDDEARLALAAGTRGFIALRWGIDSEVPVAAGQEFDIYPVEMGKQRKRTPGRNSVHAIVQKPFIVGAVAEDVPVAA
ncbi:hypothetical protein ACIBTV_27395 [Micromonospora sp. NPDC049366]|uniref:phage tail tube protein n=1 Tax=Micromonospora sp. NPDC049366 TaxID=3364271 RepID=UPI0037947626